MIKITIDSNLINTKGEIHEMNILEKWYSDKLIEIVGSQRLFDEMGDPDKPRYKKASNYQNVSEPYTVGHSKIGSSYIGLGEPKFKDIANILFPSVSDVHQLNDNQANDVMHLLAHVSSDSQIFVTNNTKDFLHSNRRAKDCLKQKQLKQQLNTLVMTPEECVIYIKNELNLDDVINDS